jgi:branched-chain amino acid transport system ATP-binding protein
VSLTVGAGEAVSLVGRTGAGKTTTIDSVMGLLPVRAGRVVFDGREITRWPAHERAALGIGYAPEDCGIFPDLPGQTSPTRHGCATGSTGSTRRDHLPRHPSEVFQNQEVIKTVRG